MYKLKNKIIAIIQCRLNSRRLPNKAILKLNKVPAILKMLNRVKKSKLIDEIWVATGKSKETKQTQRNFRNNENKKARN